MEKKSLPWLVPYGLKDAWAGAAPPRKGGAKALSVFGSLPPAWPSDPPEQLSTQERHEAWVQVLILPLPGNIMPGTSHNLSELQFQSRRLKRTREHEDILSGGWGGIHFRSYRKKLQPHRKTARWISVSGASPHHASGSMRMTPMYVY